MSTLPSVRFDPSPRSSRRCFLRQLPLAGAALAGACKAGSGAGSPERHGVLRFGLITDVHHDIMHDGVPRITAFVKAMHRARAAFVVQLGDFCWPHEKNRPFLAAWDQFQGPRHHVLGNHDMDGGFSREQAAAFFGMPARHYSFRHGGVKFVVLDGNEPGGKAKGYKRFVAAEQLDWLRAELAEGHEPVIVFLHQALDHPEGIENQAEVRAVLESRRHPDDSPRVLAVFCGHHHQDWTRTLHGIHYLQINSASYQWVGEAHAHESYPAEVHRDHPWIRMTCPYRDPLWAEVTVDLGRGRMFVQGRRSEWVGPSPWDLGMSRETMPPETNVPEIRTRRV